LEAGHKDFGMSSLTSSSAGCLCCWSLRRNKWLDVNQDVCYDLFTFVETIPAETGCAHAGQVAGTICQRFSTYLMRK